MSSDEFAELYRGFNRMAAGLQQRERLQEALELYRNRVLAEQILAGGLDLGGASVHATVLFADIRAFTSLSEKLKAQEIVGLLNRYFAAVAPAIARHGGWINKFGGDSILAVFGVPVAPPRFERSPHRASIGTGAAAPSTPAILTTDANELVGSIHDRMPVMLDLEEYDLWLDPDVQDAKRLEPLLVPYTSDVMAAYPVSTLVNNPNVDEPKCIEPLG
jgi:class 3 adenylate cyclase